MVTACNWSVRQGDCYESGASLNYIARPCLTKQNTKIKRKEGRGEKEGEERGKKREKNFVGICG